MNTLRLYGALLLGMALVASCDGPDNGDKNSKVLGSVHIPPGSHAQNAQTVNGSIYIGSNAVIDHAETVNGSVILHPHSTASSVETVNGSVHLEDGAHVTGDVELVNGHIELERGAEVAGHLSNVNGAIEVRGAHIGGGIESVTSNITIGEDSKVEGGIHVRKSGSGGLSFGAPKIPRIVIGPRVTIDGPMVFERDVQLYVSDRATIGAVQGATPAQFSGDQP